MFNWQLFIKHKSSPYSDLSLSITYVEWKQSIDLIVNHIKTNRNIFTGEEATEWDHKFNVSLLESIIRENYDLTKRLILLARPKNL